MARSDIKSMVMLFPHTSAGYENVSGNLSIRGNEFFSYNVCIARKLGDKMAEVITRKFSVTTSRHTNAVRKALWDAGFAVGNMD